MLLFFHSLHLQFDCSFYLQFFTLFIRNLVMECVHVYFLRNRHDCTGFHLCMIQQEKTHRETKIHTKNDGKEVEKE